MSRLTSDLDRFFGDKAKGTTSGNTGKPTKPEKSASTKSWLPWIAMLMVLVLAGAAAAYFVDWDALMETPDAQVSPAEASKAPPFVNSLDREFVPVPGTEVLFSVWETRVSDFEAFVNATGHEAGEKMFSLDKQDPPATTGSSKIDNGWNQAGRSWRNPDAKLDQTSQHPALGTNWEDAVAFCEWLSSKEGQTYRLPSSEEWSAAIGGSTYPWGQQFPPPANTANLAGAEARTGSWPEFFDTIENHHDSYPRTSPV